jgi:hypothetical protein
VQHNTAVSEVAEREVQREPCSFSVFAVDQRPDTKVLVVEG